MAVRTALVYEDLLDFPEDNVRREILGGELLVTPAPRLRHQDVVAEISVALRVYAKRTGGRAYGNPVDTVLSAQNVVEPDVIYIAPDRMHTLGKKAILGVPSLVVEVLSPSTQHIDRGKKREIYARFGVPEYWIVDADARTIERCNDPAGNRYQTVVTFNRDMPAATVPDFVLSFDEIFA